MVKSMLEKKEKDIFASKKQLKILETKPTQTSKVVKLQQQKYELTQKIIELERSRG